MLYPLSYGSDASLPNSLKPENGNLTSPWYLLTLSTILSSGHRKPARLKLADSLNCAEEDFGDASAP